MLNAVILMGRLTADPELKYTSGNLPVTSFAVAVDRSYVKQGAERETDFIDIAAWRSTAEFITKYFRKGSMISIQGALQVRSYTDKNDNKRKSVEVIAEKVYFCGSKKDSSPTNTGTAAIEFEEIDNDDGLPF